MNGDLRTGYKRAKLAWYTIDPIFYTSQRPDGITDADVSTYATRRVFRDEIFRSKILLPVPRRRCLP